jgi:hypothetical protein
VGRREAAGDAIQKTAGNRGRQQGLAGGDDADRFDQILGRSVLEQEAACAGP